MKTVAFMISVLAAGNIVAGAPSVEARHHFVASDSDRRIQYTVTSINAPSEARDHEVLLIEDGRGARFIFRYEYNYEEQWSQREIAVVGSTEVIRDRVWFPYTSKTRAGVLTEAKANPQLVNDNHLRFSFSNASGEIVSGLQPQWNEPEVARTWRARLRESISPRFLDALEQMQTDNVFTQPWALETESFIVERLLYRTNCGLAAQELVVNEDVPDCFFDRSFGFPCSEKQENAAKAAAEAKRATQY